MQKIGAFFKLLKVKIAGAIRYIILKEGGKISISKSLACLAGLCGLIVASQQVIIANGVIIPPVLMPICKYAAIISGIIALIRTRNAKSVV